MAGELSLDDAENSPKNSPIEDQANKKSTLPQNHDSQDNSLMLESSKKVKGWGHWNAYVRSPAYQNRRPSNQPITEAELANHNKDGDAWMALQHKGQLCVFDVSVFAEYHPGGFEVLLGASGRDATEDFRVAHAYVNTNMIANLQIGVLELGANRKTPNSLTPFMRPTPSSNKPMSQPSWDWEDTGQNDLIILKIISKRRLNQLTDHVILMTRKSSTNEISLFIRTFLDSEYHLFDIILLPSLTPQIESLNCQDDYRTVELQLHNQPRQRGVVKPLSIIGRVVKDIVVPTTDIIETLEYLSCKLLKITNLNHNCRLLEFEWPDNCRIRIPLGHHVIARAVIDDEEVTRPYTPVCSSLIDVHLPAKETDGRAVLLLVKIYPDGRMSQTLAKLGVGDSLELSVPLGRMSWAVLQGLVSVYMFAAGTGITPMTRILNTVLHHKKTIRLVHLVFFNRTEEDMKVCHEDLDELKKKFPERFQLTHVLSEPPSNWTGQKGRISGPILRDSIENLEEFAMKMDRGYLICGSLPFNKSAQSTLEELGVPSKVIFEFKG